MVEETRRLQTVWSKKVTIPLSHLEVEIILILW